MTEGRDRGPQRSSVPALNHVLERTSAGADRLLREAAAVGAIRRTAPEELTARARLSHGVGFKREYLHERLVPCEERADTIGDGYPLWKMLEHLVGHAIVPCHSRLIDRGADILSNRQEESLPTAAGAEEPLSSL